MAGFIDDLHWPAKDKLRADFDPDDFLSLTRRRGVQAVWYVAVRCPCGYTYQSGNRPDCPVCADSPGWIYPMSQDISVIATGLRREYKDSDAVQEYNSGEVKLTTRPEHCPAHMDRIYFPDARTTKSALLTRQSDPTTTHVETLNYPIVAQDYDKADGTTAYLDVLYLRPQDGTTKLPMAPMVKGVDYEITVDGHLDFTLGDARGTAPARGAFFTIAYKTAPVFRVTSFPHAVRDNRTKVKNPASKAERLPVQFAASLEWLLEGFAP